MSITRRRFIETASLSLLASATLPAAFAQSNAVLEDVTFSQERLTIFSGVTAKFFQHLVGESFAVSSKGRPLGTLKLLSITTPETTQGAKKLAMVGRVPTTVQQTLTSFLMQFQGSGTALAQGTYTMRSAGTGIFALFVVPGDSGVTGPTYTAVVNLLSNSRTAS